MRWHAWSIGVVGVALSAPVLVTGGAVAAAAEPSAAARTCRGEPATLVGSGELAGTSGRDVIVATEPKTLVRAGAGDDLICGSRRVEGQQGNDEIHYSGPSTSANRRYIRGGTGDDHIEFHKRQNHPSSGTRDGVYGGAGDDVIIGARGILIASGGSGADLLVSGPGIGIMDGGAGDDVLLGGASQDIFAGGGGDDQLRGRGRSDDLSGGAGDDEVWGGPAWDVCAPGNEIEHSCEADYWV